jgi:hypothetical protein
MDTDLMFSTLDFNKKRLMAEKKAKAVIAKAKGLESL